MGGAGQFFMNLKLGGPRNLFIDFGAAVDCGTGSPIAGGDCVRDARGVNVECPFPSGLNVRARQDGTPGGTPDETVCSAFVKAALAERTAFINPDGSDDEYILDMATTPCPAAICPGGQPMCPGEGCGGPVKLVRSVTGGEWDINFKVPRPNGNKLTIWYFTFSNLPSGHCDPGMLPEFLSIRALDVVGGVGGLSGADTWKIGTFKAKGDDDSRLACLSKAKGGSPNEFVGFFEMNFMYTIVIK